MSKERWGAAKWVVNQLRLFAVNDYTPEAEPPNTLPVMDTSIQYIQHKAFMEMLEAVWPRDTSEANAMAVLKRTHIILNSKKGFIYWRLAGEDERPVPRMLWSNTGPSKNLLS